jgi:peptidoglycan/LPS O-acetylase OafA/YrhL
MTTLTSIGVFSYSLYLVHHPVIAVLEAVIPLGPRPSIFATMLRIVVYVPICVASGYLFFIAVERHFLKHRKGQWTSWARSGSFANWRRTAAPD